MQGNCHDSLHPKSGATTDTLEQPHAHNDQRNRIDREYNAAVRQAMQAVRDAEAAELEERRREDIVITWLNEDQIGSSWAPRCPGVVRMSDFKSVPTDKLRTALEALPRLQPPVRVWNSRRVWRRAVMRILRGLRFGVSTPRVDAVVRAIASFAEHRSGRRITASYSTIARRAKLPDPEGAGWWVVRRVRKALLDIGAAMELTKARSRLSAVEKAAAERHHGGNQRAIAATTVLIMPTVSSTAASSDDTNRAATDESAADPKSPQVSESAHLSVGSNQHRNLSLVSNHSTARKRARTSSKKRTAQRSRPRSRPSLALQQLAAALVAPKIGRLQGISAAYAAGGRHMGELCAVLTDAGIDAERWSAADVCDRLNAQVKADGRTWITPRKPAAYLRYWLRKIDFTAPSPTEEALSRAEQARIPCPAVVESRERSERSVASPAARNAAKAALAQTLNKRKRTEILPI